MNKRIIHSLTGVVLSMAMTLPLFTPATVKAEEQTGYWVFTGYEYEHGDEEYYGNVHEMEYDYDEQNGEVKFYRETTFSNADGTFSAYWDSKCTIPSETIPGDSEVRLQMYTEVSGNTMDGLIYSNSCSARLGKNLDIPFYKDGTYERGYVTAKTGPDYTKAESLTVWREVDAGREAGETTEIVFEAGLGRGEDGWMRIIWNYEWVPYSDPVITPDKTISVGDKVTFKVKKKIARVVVSNEAAVSVKKKGKKVIVTGKSAGNAIVTALNKKDKELGSWIVKVE